MCTGTLVRGGAPVRRPHNPDMTTHPHAAPQPNHFSPGVRATHGARARRLVLLTTCLVILLALVSSPARADGATFTVRPLASEVVEPFDGPAAPWLAGHRGVDLRAMAGTPVRAPADGVVSFAGTVAERPVLSLRHASVGSRALMSSFEPLDAAVRPGQLVRAGQVIGWVGRGGHCDSRCLHWGLRLGGVYVDPLGWLAASVRLLPDEPRPIELPPAPSAPLSEGLDPLLNELLQAVVVGGATDGGRPVDLLGSGEVGDQARGCAWRNAARSRSVVTCV